MKHFHPSRYWAGLFNRVGNAPRVWQRMTRGALPDAVKRFGPAKTIDLLSRVGIAPRVSFREFRPAWTRGAMPTRLNNLETLHGVRRCPCDLT
ncbi:hypothetical protein LF1_22150 [Rubripirellula obstinata]|uniref:Uncharacterized protein n=1 Tax=Rubripirellula obstinata TaxID=406547 RepID=A0A5B1CJI2_9BACT|nr:hypothetical protein LF1_22150 [Rubripirellula obstinata]